MNKRNEQVFLAPESIAVPDFMDTKWLYQLTDGPATKERQDMIAERLIFSLGMLLVIVQLTLNMPKENLILLPFLLFNF